MFAYIRAYERLYDVEKEYERVFGEGSLKRCIEFLYDPVFMLSDEINNAISILQEAIEKKQPLKQMSVEDFEGIIF